MLRFFSGFQRIAPTPRDRPLVVIGSSSSEVFDYIFGDRPDYFPFWASGWSARGLRSDEHRRYLREILSPVPKTANVLMNFGCADVNFNCRHLASTKGVYDFQTVMDEAAQGILYCRDLVRTMGFFNVYAVFISPIISLPQEYWNNFSPTRQLPDRMLGKMYFDLYQATASKMKAVAAFRELTDFNSGRYVLKKEYMRTAPNHHPDYIKIQHVVWNRIRHIDGMMPMRSDPLVKGYPHVVAGIKKLIETRTTRPRTCR